MTINFGLVATLCGYLVCVAAAHYGDWILATVGATVCYLSGYLTRVSVTVTVGDK